MKLEFNYVTRNISFDLIYRKRKTMSIQVKPNGEVSVISPLGLDKDFILEKVKSKASWIVKKQYELSSVKHTKINREAVSGESFMYLGRSYSLDLILDKDILNIDVKLFRGKIVVRSYTKDEEAIKKALELWYRKKALIKIKEKIDYYQPCFKDKVANIKVKEQKRRWASCTSKNDILFNWRCIMAPSNVLDYIVVHEMCHMEYRDHSKCYWNRVRSVLPNYELRHKWLKDNGIKLDL